MGAQELGHPVLHPEDLSPSDLVGRCDPLAPSRLVRIARLIPPSPELGEGRRLPGPGHPRHEDLDEVRVMYESFSYGFFRVAEDLRTTLALGITTVRDASGADLGLKRAIEDGVLVGPRMQISVNMLGMTGGHNDAWLPSGGMSPWGLAYPGMPDGICDGVDAARAKVREMIRAGADVIKIASSGGYLSPSDDPELPHFSQDEVDAIVSTAADLGRWVMSHAHGPEGIKRAVRAGVRSIEHGTLPRRGGDLDDARARDVARAHPHGRRDHGRDGERSEDPRARAREAPWTRATRARCVPDGRRGGGEGRDGDRLPRRAARDEPARADADGRERFRSDAGPRRGHLERGRADGSLGRARDDRAGQASGSRDRRRGRARSREASRADRGRLQERGPGHRLTRAPEMPTIYAAWRWSRSRSSVEGLIRRRSCRRAESKIA